MKKLAIIAILVMVIFLTGCAYKEISTTEEKEDTDKPVKKTTTKTTSKTAPAEEAEEDDPEEEQISVETREGDTVTFKKLPDYRRDRDVTEKCDMDFPFECPKFLAKDGIIYLTIKNVGYESKFNKVVLSLNGEECDPVDNYIETGQTKEFECYEDADDYGIVSGNLEIEYYVPIKEVRRINTGTLVVMME